MSDGRDDVSARPRQGNRLPGQVVEGRIVGHLIAIEDAAMTVVGVLAETDVDDQSQLRYRLLDRAQCPLHDAVIGPGRAALGVFVLGQAEEQNRRDAFGGHLGTDPGGAVHRELVDARHRRYRAGHTVARTDEEGVDEIGHVEARLAGHPAQQGRPAETTESGVGEGHDDGFRREGGCGAGGGIRTLTPLRTTDFESVASTIPPLRQAAAS